MKKFLLTLVLMVVLVAGLFAIAGSNRVDSTKYSADFEDSGFPELIPR
ncbi:MAG: hypothetical protein WC964_03480 [Acholeplasmataceae bacterium]